jgi:hypothetical protein
MTVTIHTRIPYEGDFDFVEETKCMRIFHDITKDNLTDPVEGLPEFISDDKKMFLKVAASHYHCIYDFLGTVFFLYEKDPEINFILDIGDGRLVPSAKTTIDFALDLIKENKIKHEIVNFAGKTNFNINNFYIKTDRWTDPGTPNKILKYAKNHIRNESVDPFRKVYVSRRIADERKMKSYGKNLSDKLTRSSYARIDDETKLEKFFANNGFEVVFPEDFDTFDDQLNYFYETKVAIGLTGGGLTNLMFMQDKGIVVELITTLITNRNDRQAKVLRLEEGQHHFYHSIAFQKEHEYVGVINKTISADDIIKKFETLPHLMALLGK